MEHQRSRTPQKFYGFHSFAEPGFPVSFAGAFRDNIREFLVQCAEPEDYDLDGMPIWCTFLVYEGRGTVLPLFTVEEDVKHSERPFCDYCRCAGWSHHFVTKRKYHMIIPANEVWNKPLDEGAFDLHTHLLHGLIHCNGFGHLICINGIEGGSKFICGREIMDLWDRICTALHARQISVEDMSRKRIMDLRLLYGVAYGQSWFGQWGYQFCRGSFGVKEHHYRRAIDSLSSLELTNLIDDLSLFNRCASIKQTINQYIEMSEANLVSLKDLFRFMLSLKSSAPSPRCSVITATFPSWSGKKLTLPAPIKRCSLKCSRFTLRSFPCGKEKTPTKCRKFSTLAANLDSRWPVRRLEHVAEVIVEALKDKKASNLEGSCGMTRQEARDAARVHIGDTGLIDHVLKVMNNVIVGHYIVRRAVNKCTKVLEYTIQDLKSIKEACMPKVPESMPICPDFTVFGDLAFLYNSLFLGNQIPDALKFAVQVILYSKNYVKEWPFRDEDDHSLRFICRFMMSSVETISDVSFDILPREYIVVPLYATVSDLKLAVQNAVRDTYCVMEKMFVTEILDMEGVCDDEVIFGILESGRELWVRCCGLDLENNLRYQGGNENWTVKCKCGARDDDGERMVACDVCETWQHTRCSGIEDSEGVPRLFVCDECCCLLAPANKKCKYTFNWESYNAPPTFLAKKLELDTVGLVYSE